MPDEITAYITVKFEGEVPDSDELLDAIRNELDRQPGIEFRSAGIELRKGWDDDDPSRPMVSGFTQARDCVCGDSSRSGSHGKDGCFYLYTVPPEVYPLAPGQSPDTQAREESGG